RGGGQVRRTRNRREGLLQQASEPFGRGHGSVASVLQVPGAELDQGVLPQLQPLLPGRRIEVTNSQDIVAALKNPAIVMSSDDIKVCWDLLKARHSNLQTLQAQSFRVGDRVEFDARGSTKKGVVRKINRKTITV